MMAFYNYYRDDSLPEVQADELFTSSGFKDKTFESFVRDWMARNMPSMPLDLLDTDDIEAWEIQRPERFTVREIEFMLWECAECGDEHAEKPDLCCEVDGEDELETPAELIEQAHTGYVIIDTEDDSFYGGHRRGWPDRTEPHPIWADEEEANDVARQASADHEHEGSYGFPWANSWFFYPDSWIDTDTLMAAGFVVAEYKGHRLCGIDGGGYSFDTHHYAKLVVLMSEHKGLRVSTDNGDAYATTDDRTEAEKFVAAVTASWEEETCQ